MLRGGVTTAAPLTEGTATGNRTAPEVLASLPAWYTLACSGGFRRAVTLHLTEQSRFTRQHPWLAAAEKAIVEASMSTGDVDGATMTESPSPSPSRGGGRAEHPQLSTSGLARLGGLVGDGSYASERLTAAEAQFRGVPHTSSYGGVISEKLSNNRSRSVGGGGQQQQRSSSLIPTRALNSSYMTRPASAGVNQPVQNLSTSSSIGGAGRKFLHLDGGGGVDGTSSSFGASSSNSKRLPIVIASPSFTADPTAVADAAASFINTRGGTAAPPPTTSSGLNGSHCNNRNLSSTLTAVPVRRAQHNSGRRELLMHKAHVIANVIANGQLYVSPVTGHTTAWRRGTAAGGNSSAHVNTTSSPSKQQRANSTSSFATETGRNWQTRSTHPADGLHVTGANVTTGSMAAGDEQLAIAAAPSSSSSSANAREVLAVLAAGAAEVSAYIAPDTADLLLEGLQHDYAVTIAKKVVNVVPSTAASTRVDGSHDEAKDAALGLGVPMISYTITGATAHDQLVGLARREMHALDEAAEVLEHGEIEHSRRRLAREASGERLGLSGATKAAEEALKALPLLSNSAVMVGLRTALGFGLDGIDESFGFREEIAKLITPTAAPPSSTSPPPPPAAAATSPSSQLRKSPALAAVLEWLWSALRAADETLNAVHVPIPLRISVMAGESAADRRESEAQRTNTVASALVEALLILCFDIVCGGLIGGGGASPTAPAAGSTDGGGGDSTALVTVDVDGFGIPTASPSFSAAAMAIHASGPIPSQVRRFAEETNGFADKRHVMLNSSRLLLVLREVLGPLVEVASVDAAAASISPSRPSASTSPPLLESGTELIDEDDYHTPARRGEERTTASAATVGGSSTSSRDDELALLILVMLSRISIGDIVTTAAAIMRPLWDSLTIRSGGRGGGGEETTTVRAHMSHQLTPLSPSGRYDPPFIDMSVVASIRQATGGKHITVGGSPLHSPARQRGSSASGALPHRQNSNTTAVVSMSELTASLQQQQKNHHLRGGGSSSSAVRPESASSLKTLLHGSSPHRRASEVADEVLAKRQLEDELASPLPSVGISKRDPMTRVSKDEFNLERVLMSRLSRRMVNAAIESSDLSNEKDLLLAGGINSSAREEGGCGRPSSPTTGTGGANSSSNRPPTPTQPSNLTKLLNDLHVRPLLPVASTPINSGLTASPNRVGLGGSTRNNAMPPFMAETNATTYRTIRAYNDPPPPPSALSCPSSPLVGARRGVNGISSATVPDAAANAAAVTDTHFVQYLQKGIISEPFQKQLAHANPFIMSTLQRAAEVGVAVGGGEASSSPPRPRSAAASSSSVNDAKALQAILTSPSYTVKTPAKTYMYPTGMHSKTRQHHFQHIKEHLLDPQDAAAASNNALAAGGDGDVSRIGYQHSDSSTISYGARSPSAQQRPGSASAVATSAAMAANSSIIVAGSSSPPAATPHRPRSSNFFSRTPTGFGHSFSSNKTNRSNSSAAAMVNASLQHHYEQNVPASPIRMAARDGAAAAKVITVRDPIDGTVREVALGSDFGETPNEVRPVGVHGGNVGNGNGSRGNTPTRAEKASPLPIRRPSSSSSKKDDAEQHTPLQGRIRDVGDRSPSDFALVRQGSPTSPPSCGRVHGDGAGTPHHLHTAANGAVTLSTFTSGPPVTAPSIPSPARKRFGLPVRDVDRVVAARELAASAHGNTTTNNSGGGWSPYGGGSVPRSQSLTRPSSSGETATTKRAQPRVLTDLSALPHTPPASTSPAMIRASSAHVRGAGAGYTYTSPQEPIGNPNASSPVVARLSHRPVSAKNRDERGANPNGAIVLVPQMAALPITSGGSFSQRLSAGHLGSPSGRQKRF